MFYECVSTKTKNIFIQSHRTVFEESVDSIPSAGDRHLDKLLCCDVCIRKEDKLKLAQIYCVVCKKKFCDTHMQVPLSASTTPSFILSTFYIVVIGLRAAAILHDHGMWDCHYQWIYQVWEIHNPASVLPKVMVSLLGFWYHCKVL